MSSPLEGRIRALAREEATALLGVGQPNESAHGTAELQQQITDLHEHLHVAATSISRLEQRIDALEKAPGQTDQEERPTARRTPRKTGGITSTPE
jgi:hypothetical protein